MALSMNEKNHFGKVFKKILSLLEEKNALTFMQLDPPKYSPEQSGKIVELAEKNGLDAVAVGGSLEAQGQLLDETIKEIKKRSTIPVILFPGNIATLSKYADAAYFMYLLNSNDPYFISGAQIAGALPLKKMGVEPIPTSYILIEPGRAAGWIGKAQLIPRNLPYLAAATALAGQFMGSHLVILESGGGAESPAPKEMVSLVKKTIDIPLLVAGGIRTAKMAFETIKAGADIIQIGTALEETKGDIQRLGKKIKEMTSAVSKAAKQKSL
jgi:phosphoglycerol geranylgeranyltransferase